jgi:prepilin-type N-terminal cleavage/methylation domain-containing protein
MGLAPSGNGENPGKSAVAKVPVPISSQPRSAGRPHRVEQRHRVFGIGCRVANLTNGRTNMPVHSNRDGFTMRELLVVVTLICLLLAIIVPAVRISREASRRAYCNSNLKNIGLALQNYHDTYRRFPMGVWHAGLAPGGDPPIEAALGPSWWYTFVPFMESGRLHDRMAATQRVGGPARCEFTANDMIAARVPVGWLSSGLRYLRCPSRPLPTTPTCKSSCE